MTLMQQMSGHATCCGFAVCSCHAESFKRTGEGAQYLSSFLDFESVLLEMHQFFMFGRYGGRIYYQGRADFPARIRNLLYILGVMDAGTFVLKFSCQVARCLVITANG